MKTHDRTPYIGEPGKASMMKAYLLKDLNEVRKEAYRKLAENSFRAEETASAKTLRDKNAWHV